jgi:hypothetical protein
MDGKARSESAETGALFLEDVVTTPFHSREKVSEFFGHLLLFNISEVIVSRG